MSEPLENIPSKRTRRTSQDVPDDVDERSKLKASAVTKVHEFRRENIRDFEEPDRDYFEYDPDE
jgi:hypothetical protein